MHGVGLDKVAELLDGYPGFVPGLIVAIVVAVLAHGWLAARLRIGRGLATALILAIGIVAAATLFPDVIGWWTGAVGPAGSSWSCDLGRLRPSLGEFLDAGESTANTMLFIPLGVVVVLLPREVRAPAIVLSIASPFAIELIQSAVPSLDRQCQTADIADNLTGLAIGLAIGAVVAWWRGRRAVVPVSSR
jgi:VanZ like family